LERLTAMPPSPDSLPPVTISPHVLNLLKNKIIQLTIENEQLRTRLAANQASINQTTKEEKKELAERFMNHIADLVFKQQAIINKLEVLSQKLINEKPNNNKKRKIISNDS
jgi:hypothetical protein